MKTLKSMLTAVTTAVSAGSKRLKALLVRTTNSTRAKMRGVSVSTKTIVRQQAKRIALVALAITGIILLPKIVVMVSLLDSLIKVWILDKIMPWSIMAWAENVLIWEERNPISAMIVQITSVILTGTFVVWAYRRRNPKVTPNPSSPPTSTTPTPAKTPAATQAAKPIAWKKWVGATIGWVVVIAVVGFLAKAGYDNYTRPGHGVIGAVGQFFSPDRTETQTQQRKVVTSERIVVIAPPAPEWSEEVPTPGPTSFDPLDEEVTISIMTSNGDTFSGVKRNRKGTVGFGKTSSLRFQSDSEEPTKVEVFR